MKNLEIDNPQVLGEQILYQQGSFKRVKRYLKGFHPELGKLYEGLSGKETIQEKDIITPVITFYEKH
jgi:hypothetical protein